MPTIVQVSCDVCGKVRKESNHWWVLTKVVGSKAISIYPLRTRETDSMEITLCGMECLFKKITEFLQ